MNNKLVLGVLIFLLVIGLTSFVRLNDVVSIGGNVVDSQRPVQDLSNNSIVVDNSGGSEKLITSQDLSAHDSMDDCWIAFEGKVYEVTSYLHVHPGGANAILPYCGTSSEFEQAFTRKHGKSQVGKLISVGVLMGDFEVQGGLA